MREASAPRSGRWRIVSDEDLPASRLRIPEAYFVQGDPTLDLLLDVLERNDFPEMVESEDGICWIITRSEADPAGEVVLTEC